MYREGHIGFSLLILSLVMFILNVWDYTVLLIAILFSIVPDLDLKFGISHRKWTHNVFAGLVFGVLAGGVTYLLGLSFKKGFFSAFTGVTLHIFGDLLTYKPFAPFWPVSNRKVALKLFRSSSFANKLMFVFGLLVFIFLSYHRLLFELEDFLNFLKFFVFRF